MSEPSIYSCQDVSTRLSWDDLYIGFARMLSGRSTCKRAKVGCVITSWDYNEVLSIGYNGNYKGGPNTCDNDEVGACGCLHAEENALIKLDYNSPVKKRLYTTTSPCLMCAKRIINANINFVLYDNQYRDTSGIELLEKNNVQVLRLQRFDTNIPIDFDEEPIY